MHRLPCSQMTVLAAGPEQGPNSDSLRREAAVGLTQGLSVRRSGCLEGHPPTGEPQIALG